MCAPASNGGSGDPGPAAIHPFDDAEENQAEDERGDQARGRLHREKCDERERTGNTPGIPKSIREAWVFGSLPNAVDAAEKIFDCVASWV